MAITPNRTPNISILGDLRQQLSNAGTPAAREERKPADYWLNVGVTLNINGEEVFIGLPQGLALDDMKPQVIRGSNAEWIQMAQTKNALLTEIQKAAANLKPGDRLVVGQLQVELHRRAEPAQEGNPNDNPLMSQLMSTLGATGTNG